MSIVLHCVSKMDRAGQETFIMNVYRKIDRNKIQFNFLCSDNGKGEFDEEIESLGGEIFCLPQNAVKNGVKKYIKRIEILTKWFSENHKRFDIIHVHTYHALDVFVHLEAARRARIDKIIIHSHNTSGPHKRLHKFMQYVNKLYKFKKFACAYDAGVWLFGKSVMQRGDADVVYNGIEIIDFKYDEKVRNDYKKKLNLDGKNVIGHIGRFNHQKNHEFIIEIFEKYEKSNPNSVLMLVGKGEQYNKIVDLVKSKNLEEKVMFLGSRNDVPNLMTVMDVLLFPSLFEGLSVVLVEAQAAGLQSLVSDNIVPEEELIIPELLMKQSLKNGSEQWADGLAVLLSNTYNRENYNDIMLASKFNVDYTVEKIEKVYLEMTNN